MPSVSRYMVEQPWTIPRTATLADAHKKMREHSIRHLPVVDGSELVGVVSLGDLHLLETIAEFSLEDVTVDEAMTARPFIVTGDAPLDEVVDIMAEHKYGSVIVMGRSGVEGIFTAVDACRVLADLLREVEIQSLGEPVQSGTTSAS
jgi:acetoin utilization protein AcuB